MKRSNAFTIILFCVCLLFLRTAHADEIFPTVLKRVVMIIAMDENYQPIAIGSGFIVGEKGEIATNYHVIEGASSAIVKFVTKDEKYSVDNILQISVKHDLAIIQIDANTEPLSLGDDELVTVGNRIYAIGNPEGLEGTVSEGIVSGFRKVDEGFRLMQITAPISPGSSGGPVVNQNGQVIGVASASILLGQNLNFAVPAKQLRELISKPSKNLPFKKVNLPKDKGHQISKQTKDTDLVTVFNINRGTKWTDTARSQDVSFSIRNDTRRDIRNIKLLIIWKAGEEPLHFTAMLVKDTIPSLQTKLIHRPRVEAIGLIPYYYVRRVARWGVDSRVSTPTMKEVMTEVMTEVRIIDYEILQSSGLIEFK